MIILSTTKKEKNVPVKTTQCYQFNTNLTSVIPEEKCILESKICHYYCFTSEETETIQSLPKIIQLMGSRAGIQASVSLTMDLVFITVAFVFSKVFSLTEVGEFRSESLLDVLFIFDLFRSH